MVCGFLNKPVAGELGTSECRMSSNDELNAMTRLARRLVESDTPGTLATLFSACGSTYRPLGSMMVSLPGTHAGGISGGCLEDYVARVGERVTRNCSAAMLRFRTDADADDNIPVLGCGGSIEVLVERLEPGHVAFLEHFADASERDECGRVACLVTRDGESLSVVREWLDRDTPGETESVHRTLTSDTDVLVQYIPPLTRLVIFGAGDDARPLCEMARMLGWHVTMADRRPRYATLSRFPNARMVLAGDWDDIIDDVTFSSHTAAVLMTHSLDDDAKVLSLLWHRPLTYIGALGPAHRRDRLLEEAASMRPGRAPGATMNVHGPIGLDLGERSPAGIAVAVTAEILAHMNGRDAQPCHLV